MAVTTGTYELAARIDLAPVFGTIEHTTTVEVTAPGEKILERRLEELLSKDEAVRRAAVLDLRNFPGEGAAIAPALVRAMSDESSSIRLMAVIALSRYPEAAEHLDEVYALLEGGEGISVSEKIQAAYLLARRAPVGERVETALTAALEESKDPYRRSFESALTTYRRRVPKTAD